MPEDPSAGFGPPTFVVFGRTPFSEMVSPWHLLARRLTRSHRVVYVQDPVRLSAALFAHPSRTLANGIVDLVPREWPLQRFGPMREACLKAAVRAIRKSLADAPRPWVALLYPRSPVSLARALESDLIVYVGTDDYSRLADGTEMQDAAFLKWERRVVEVSDLLLPGGAVLEEHLKQYGHPRSVLLPLSYDDELFDGGTREAPPALRDVPRPILGFAGTVRASRLDIPLILDVARSHRKWSLVFLGPVLAQDGKSVSPLRRLPNVRFLNCASVQEVPSFVAAFDVALAPYRDLHGNRGYYPLKVFDSMAMGRPAVVSPWAELTELAPHVRFARGSEDFSSAVESALKDGNGADVMRQRQTRVAHRTTTIFVQRFEAEVREALAR